MTFSRRQVLGGAVGTVGAVVAGGAGGFGIARGTESDDSSAVNKSIPFYGPKQAGIATPAQDRLAFADGGFARLELGAKTANLASRRAALAAGFAPDGVRAARLRNPDGSYSDEVRFALINPSV